MIALIFNRIKREIFLILFIITLGTAGYILIEGYTPIEALFMTVITITTVGYGEVRPLDNAGMLFSIMLIFSSFGTLAFATSRILDYAFSEYPEERERVKMRSRLKKLKDHIIICGCGRMGSVVAKELKKNKKDFVIIEADHNVCEQAKKNGFLVIEGNATSDELLLLAGIKEAKTVVAITSSESDNGFISLSAKKLNPNVSVISRANNAEWISKLRLAGADEVISPHSFGARRIASYILNPAIVEFLDIVRDETTDIFMEEIIISKNSILSDKVFMSWDELREYFKVSALVPLSYNSGRYTIYSRDKPFTFKESDRIIIIGSKSDIERANKIAAENNIV